MKFNKATKIISLVITILVVVLIGFIAYNFFVLKNIKLNIYHYSFFVMFLLGVLAVCYHLITLNAYSKTRVLKFESIKLLWFSNMVFSAVLFCFMLYVCFRLFQMQFRFSRAMTTDDVIGAIILLLVLVLSVFSIMEAAVFYKKIIKNEAVAKVDTIDDIVGVKNGDDNF